MNLPYSVLLKQLNRGLLVGALLATLVVVPGLAENTVTDDGHSVTQVVRIPEAITESHEGAFEILPDQYRQYATKMNTVVKDYDAGFEFTLPWRVADGVHVNMDVKSDSEHIQGYSFNLTTAGTGEAYTVSFTKRNNTPTPETSQKVWNTTWYDIPIKGLTNAKYLEIWRKNSGIFEHNSVDGGFFEKKDAQAARWSRITPKQDSDETVGSLMEVEFIMNQDPTHRYNMASTYPSTAQTFMEAGILETIVPSFSLIDQSDYEKTGDIMVDDGVSFVKPAGFSRVKSTGKIAFTKGNIQLDVESIAIPWQAISAGVPTLLGKQTLGDNYVASLVKVHDARIDRYEMRIINNRVAFYVSGVMNDPSQAYTTIAQDSVMKPKASSKRVAFASEIVLGNQGKVGVARMVGPEGTELIKAEFIDVLDGLRIDDIIGSDGTSTVL